jgi:DNA-binding NarL/FixJ family response regulator
MKKIGIIDDDQSFRNLIEEALHFNPHFKCLLSAESTEHFWDICPAKANIDIMLVDIDLPGESGIDALPRLARRFPEAELIMLTRIEEPKALFNALSQGAGGYLVKGFPVLQLPQLLQTIDKGGALISPLMARHLVEYFAPQNKGVDQISKREEQVLQLFKDGNSYDEVAEIMGMTLDGVRFHVKNIYKKLNVHNKIDAIKTFFR